MVLKIKMMRTRSRNTSPRVYLDATRSPSPLLVPSNCFYNINVSGRNNCAETVSDEVLRVGVLRTGREVPKKTVIFLLCPIKTAGGDREWR